MRSCGSRSARLAAQLVAALGLSLVSVAAAPGHNAVFRNCSYQGPPWKLRDGRTGTTWVLEFQNTTCAFARPFAKKLATLNAPAQYGAKVPGGPTGWRCQALVTPPGKIISGSCVNGTRFFQWHAAY